MESSPTRLPLFNRDSLLKMLATALIVGLLAGIAVPLFLDQRKKGHDGAAKETLTNVADAITAYAEANQELPTVSVSGSNAQLDDGTTITILSGVILGDLTGAPGSWCIDDKQPHGDRAKVKGYKYSSTKAKVEEGQCA